jgi:ribosome-associated protein
MEKIISDLRLNNLAHLVLESLHDLKAQKIMQLDVSALTSITETMFIATGNSDQHIRSIGEYVARKVKEAGFHPPLSSDFGSSDWVLLDLGDVVVHVMKQSAREYYALEKLWNMEEEDSLVAHA